MHNICVSVLSITDCNLTREWADSEMVSICLPVARSTCSRKISQISYNNERWFRNPLTLHKSLQKDKLNKKNHITVTVCKVSKKYITITVTVMQR